MLLLPKQGTVHRLNTPVDCSADVHAGQALAGKICLSLRNTGKSRADSRESRHYKRNDGFNYNLLNDPLQLSVNQS